MIECPLKILFYKDNVLKLNCDYIKKYLKWKHDWFAVVQLRSDLENIRIYDQLINASGVPPAGLI